MILQKFFVPDISPLTRGWINENSFFLTDPPSYKVDTGGFFKSNGNKIPQPSFNKGVCKKQILFFSLIK